MSLPTIHRQSVDLSRFLTFPGFYASGRYYRGQNLRRITRATKSLTVIWSDMASGGGKPKLPPGVYRLFLDGRQVGEVTLEAFDADNRLDIPIDLSVVEDLDRRWVLAHAEGPNLPSIRWPHFLNLSGEPITEQPDVIPVVGTSHALAQGMTRGRFRWTWIPRERIGAAKPVPLVPRECVNFDDAPGYGSLHRTNMVVPSGEDNHRPNVARDGIVSTFNKQNYFWSDLIEQYPKQHQLDGPRGVGAINFPTHIEPNRKGGAHICNPWRLARMTPDGALKTLVGWYHDPLPIYHEDSEGKAMVRPKLAGDWSAVAAAGHPLGFWETWGFCWRTPSLAIDESAEKLGPPRNLAGFEHPHFAPGPQAFLADARHGRVLKFQFPHDDHREPLVTEFIVGLNDPWDIRYRKSTDTIIVSERQSHRVVEYSAETGVPVRVIVQGASGKADVVLPSRFVRQLVATDIIRREDVVLPEGIALLEHGGEEWLYYGSVAMREVRRVNLATGAIEHVCYPIYTNGQSHYYKIAVSDGTFGPAGTCFVTSWTIARHGFPQAFLPDGSEWKVHYFGRALQGFPNITETIGYGCAVGVGRAANGDMGGRLFVGGSHEGIAMISRALPTDVKTDTAKLARGRQAFFDRDLDLLFADSASLFGYEPPWGENPDLDYWFEHLGYARAEQPVPDPEPDPQPDPEPDPEPDPQPPTLEEQLAAAQAELADVRAQLAEKERAIDALETDLEASRRDLAITREELDAAHQQAGAVDALVRAARQALEQADAMVAD